MHDVHGHDSGAEAAGAASWMVAMVLFVVLTVAVIVALFAWAPWNDGDATPGTGTEENNPDIQGDININDNTDPNSGGNAPQQSP